MITSVLAAGIGTIAFSVIFCVPKRYYPGCGIIGAAGWFLYLLLSSVASAATATFFATVVVILLSRLVAVWMECPVTLFLIPGIFPLVPGAGVYYTVYYIVANQLDVAAAKGLMASKVAVAIVLGIVLVFEIPQKFFHAIKKVVRKSLGRN